MGYLRDPDPLLVLTDDICPDEILQPFTAFAQGNHAARLEMERSLNPYRHGSREWIWWDAGFGIWHSEPSPVVDAIHAAWELTEPPLKN